MIERYDGALDTKDRLEDVVYWYGERALTGLLAAAAWQTNRYWSAVPEFLGKRNVDPRLEQKRKRKRSGRRAGRGDLWLSLRVDHLRGTQSCFTVEGKQLDRGYDPTKIPAAINRKLGVARRQLRHLDPVFRSGYPVAACFYIPAIHDRLVDKWYAGRVFETVRDRLVREDPKNMMVAAVWRPRSLAPVDESWTFPGVLFAARVYDRLPGGRGMPAPPWQGRPSPF